MKTVKTTITVLAILLTANFAWSSGNVKLIITPGEKESALVEISKRPQTEVEIEVKNDFGDIVFYKLITEPVANYTRKYDFSAMENGNYLLSVTSASETNEARFKIHNGLISLQDERKVMVPHFKVDGNIGKLSYLNFPMESLDLYVYDKNLMVYHKKIEPDFAIHEGLDLSRLVPGDYQIVLANEYDSYEYNVNVK
jgi:hypothetical protein